MIKNLEQIEMKEVAGGQTNVNYECVCTKQGAAIQTTSEWATGCALYCCKSGTYTHWVATFAPGGGTFTGAC